MSSFAQVIRRLIALQLVLMAVVAVFFYLQSGAYAAVSVWFGGLTATLNILLLQWRSHRADSGRALSAGQSLWVLYRTALERFVMVVLLFVTGLGLLKLDPLALLTGFVVGQLALILMGMKGKSANHVV